MAVWQNKDDARETLIEENWSLSEAKSVGVESTTAH